MFPASIPRTETTDGGQRDDDLMRRVQRGDADAFAELYERHATRAFRVARAVCGNVGHAEDAVQEGFLGIWRGRGSYKEGVAGFQGWAMGIVRHRAIDSGRRTAARRRLLTAEGVDDARRTERDAVSTEDAVAVELGRGVMLASLRLLPGPQEEVIVLAYFGELSQTEIAVQLGLPLGTVKSRMRLGLRKLRLQMGEGEPGGVAGATIRGARERISSAPPRPEPTQPAPSTPPRAISL